MTVPNPLIGEAEYRGLKLRLDYDRFCALELATGKKMRMLCAEFEYGLGLSDLRVWLRVLAEGDPSEAEVDAVIHQGGMIADYEAVTKVLGDMMTAFFAPPKEKKGRPPKAE